MFEAPKIRNTSKSRPRLFPAPEQPLHLMTLVPSLLQALVLMDGEALVLHVGDKPYVVAESGQVSLANAPLTADAIGEVIDELLPAESKRLLDEVGATQCALPENHLFPAERFSVVAARGGDNLWLEVRRLQESPRLDADAGNSIDSPASQAPLVRERRKGQRTVSQAPSGRVVEPALPQSEAPPAVVLPLTRTPVRADVPPPLAESALSGLDRLAAARRRRAAHRRCICRRARGRRSASTANYRALEGDAVLEPNDVESLLLTLMPERNAEALRTGAASEWIADFADLGRVRCLSFRDHRGPGGVFRIMPTRAVTAEQLGLSREIQALADRNRRSVLVAGPRLSGKRTLMSAFVDLINRTRHVHIITIEREINIVHERGRRSSASARCAAARTTCRQRRARRCAKIPTCWLSRTCARRRADEPGARRRGVRPPGHLRLPGAQRHRRGRPHHRPVSAPEHAGRCSSRWRRTCAASSRRCCSKKTGGGRLAAREVLLNTPAVASVIAEGKTSQLPLAIEGGRSTGWCRSTTRSAALCRAERSTFAKRIAARRTGRASSRC